MELYRSSKKEVPMPSDQTPPRLPQRARPHAMADEYRKEALRFLYDERQAVHAGLTDTECAQLLGRAVVVIESLVACLPQRDER